VIGESSRNARGNQCFKCQGYGHFTARCPSRKILIKEAKDDQIEIVVYEPIDSATDSDDDVRISSTQLGVVRCSHTAVSNED